LGIAREHKVNYNRRDSDLEIERSLCRRQTLRTPPPSIRQLTPDLQQTAESTLPQKPTKTPSLSKACLGFDTPQTGGIG
jgi:hypothetical protein